MKYSRPCRTALLFILLASATWSCFAETSAGQSTSQADGSSAAAAPDPVPDHTPVNFANWAYHPAPGAQVTLQEDQRTSTSKGTKIIFSVETAGFPAGKKYTIWMMESGDDKTFPVFTGYTTDATGKLVCADDPGPKAYCFNQVKLDIHDYHMAEPIHVAVISTDGTVRAYAKAYPFPVQGQDAGCALTVTMDNSKATLFSIEATGFEPQEEVMVTTTAGKAGTKSQQVSAKGNFAYIIDYSHGMGANSGSETFTVAAKSCHPSVTYDWGKTAMKVQ